MSDDGIVNIPASMLPHISELQDMSEDEVQQHLQVALDAMSFEQQSEFWRAVEYLSD